MTDYLTRLNDVLPKGFVYDHYYHFNGDRLEKKKLNIVQCFFRKLLGWYQETHLLGVAKKAYTITFNGEFKAGVNARQNFLEVFHTADRVYKEKSALKFPSFNSGQPGQVTVKAGYKVLKQNEQDKTTFAIKSIYFHVSIGHGFYTLEISKTKGVNYQVILPAIFDGVTNDTKEVVKARLENSQSRLINQLLRQILIDSRDTNMSHFGLNFYATDYENLNSTSPRELNNARCDALGTLGWACETTQHFILEEQRIRGFPKLKDRGFQGKLDLRFATDHLIAEPQPGSA